ncbi:MetQ/NlpA family ABC transporter substrate-binding protein [Ketogulonicigenium vulgare]|uniref:Lipoprotein n=1 Tax=Ketogulonicigenium vulgare (strain WSH-001) TaxID=759362 RepID=F9Y6G4_KETVW|nr:MetQ/NlpA family ABC transporter substrate-binding protein [Ketogulonicigenium vulgare]AEM40910.1 ABC transporter substrate-binding protein, putative [Ketogulonicigenium vulgare WSH-001]ALJ81062.1 ABC transporter substrate-binding protein [Ketogulonicigenium vulgare]ANW33817.1 ABC transporter substrate-binding protein [Ketogulonicigenium vulgare]AOZ54629.1 ABC transporter substrate-binding protein, putative [Ketogulonicigenium vulgare]
MLKTILTATALSTIAMAASADTLRIGASPVPHAEILEQAKPILAEQGIDLEIIIFQDYILPNTALAGGDIDANYFQHVPYLTSVLAENPDFDFVNAGDVHIEPIGIYSRRFESLQDLPEGGRVILRDSVAEEGRILSIFQREGVVGLREGVAPVDIRISDIVDNPKNLTFLPDIEAALLPQVYFNDEADAVTINANYALGAGLDPVADPIAVESATDNPYANIITVRAGDETRPDIQALVEVLHSDAIRTFINENYKGAVIPVELQ